MCLRSSGNCSGALIVDAVCDIVRSDDTAADRIQALVEFVSEAGLEAPPPAEPLPVIERDDVRLVCWAAVSPLADSHSGTGA